MDRSDDKRTSWGRGRGIHKEDTLPDLQRTAKIKRLLDGPDADRPLAREEDPDPHARAGASDRDLWRARARAAPRQETRRMYAYRDAEPPLAEARAQPPRPEPRRRVVEEPRGGRRGPWWHREPLSAGEIMTREVRTVARETPLPEVAALMRTENVGLVSVAGDDRRLVGLVTERDIVLRGCTADRPIAALTAGDVMTEEVVAVYSHEPVRGVLELMAHRQVRCVPVVDEGDHILGMVSIADIASRADYDRELQDAFARISARRSFWSRLWR
jgi:CBS domain-containing protein